ncbi:hypothetical protein FIBSPDRAFT_937881 [Athelia psychrophila]|uniref:Uncharacterized protein n=1 Tax=Athelia psychrophila TaxID=1759441 RepID=A0A165ZP67_9AGAM|nr:hypothetical protein FIBSPDRAFT_937881 [Fibularhizoctonia sp. CBS 109695]
MPFRHLFRRDANSNASSPVILVPRPFFEHLGFGTSGRGRIGKIPRSRSGEIILRNTPSLISWAPALTADIPFSSVDGGKEEMSLIMDESTWFSRTEGAEFSVLQQELELLSGFLLRGGLARLLSVFPWYPKRKVLAFKQPEQLRWTEIKDVFKPHTLRTGQKALSRAADAKLTDTEHYDPRCEPWTTVHPMWVGLDYGVVGCEAVFHRSSTANPRKHNTITMTKSVAYVCN